MTDVVAVGVLVGVWAPVGVAAGDDETAPVAAEAAVDVGVAGPVGVGIVAAAFAVDMAVPDCPVVQAAVNEMAATTASSR